MRPAYSVIFLTTLTGAGQGLVVALFAAEALARAGWLPAAPDAFFTVGAAFAVALAALGLLASFFHLGRPERAWRAAAMWRTSWLSREVIALPVFMAASAAYGAAHHAQSGSTLAVGVLALAACAALFVCTAMIYAGVRFLQEWASPLTVVNFILIGTASGFTLATALAASLAPTLLRALAVAAAAITLVALGTRSASLLRNARLRPRSTPQSAIGIARSPIEQKSRGFTGESFNTQEFFHGASPAGMRAVVGAFVQLGFLLPPLLLAAGVKTDSPALLTVAFAVQLAGLVLERWYFLAQANHPQNLYYRGVS